MKNIITIMLSVIMLCSILIGCEKDSKNNADIDEKEEAAYVALSEKDFNKTQEDMFTERDSEYDYDEKNAVIIKLNGTSATASSNSVRISGSNITITEEATYIVSGELSDGMLIVNAPDTAKLQIVFDGVNINSQTSAAFYVLEADKVFVTLAEGSENILSNGGSYTSIDDNNIDGTLFSKQDLTFNGNGKLTINSPGGHGIVGKDDLVFTSGNYSINSASHGLDVNDSIRIKEANIAIEAGKDAIHVENNEELDLGYVYIANGTINGKAEGDGISASAYMHITGGTIDILAGGGSENGEKPYSDNFGGFMGRGPMGAKTDMVVQKDISTDSTVVDENSTSMKGLKANNSLMISGGNITINSADDSIHSDTSVYIKGGNYTISSGDDGIHAEDSLVVTDGNIDISECYEGLEALHIDVQGGDIKLKATDDGINAAGGVDKSGIEGGRDGMFDNLPNDREMPNGGRRPKGKEFPNGERKPNGGGKHNGGMSSNSDGSIKISGGTLYINSAGDGLDANGTLEISGGYTTVVGPIQGDTATLDYDTSGVIKGGIFVGTGATGMAQSFSDSEQGVIAINVGNQVAGTNIVLKDKEGEIIIEYSPELDFALLILSSPELKKGENYVVTIGSESREFEVV